MNNFLRILFGVVAATSASFTSAAVLVDNSNIKTGTANGFNGANTSSIASTGTSFGFSSNSATATSQLADDFAVAQQVNVSNVTVYGYSTSAAYPNPPTSPFSGVTVSIWSAQPGSSGATILSTSTTFTTSWTGVYRVTSTTLTNALRPVMALKASFPPVTLPAGSYWVSWGITGVAAPGNTASAFTPPRMNTNGTMPAGNSVQSTDGGVSWIAITDLTTSATSDLPLLVEGTVSAVQTATTTSLIGSPNPTTLGNGITLTANVSGNSPTGTVQFFADSSVITGCGSVALNSGVAACVVSAASLHVGLNPFSATYSGDATNLGSSGNFIETVSKAAAGVTLGSACQTTFTPGEPFTFAATVTGQSPTGTVSFLVNSGPVTGCSNVALSGGSASCTVSDLPQGTLSLTANYSGDANNTSANSGTLTVTVLDPSDVIFRDNFETATASCPIE